MVLSRCGKIICNKDIQFFTPAKTTKGWVQNKKWNFQQRGRGLAASDFPLNKKEKRYGLKTLDFA